MFVYALQSQVILQVMRIIPFGNWGRVFVGCSGSFRFDRAVKQRHPGVEVHANDVSLLSCGIGAMATGAEFSIRFKDRLESVESRFDGSRAAGSGRNRRRGDTRA